MWEVQYRRTYPHCQFLLCFSREMSYTKYFWLFEINRQLTSELIIDEVTGFVQPINS